MVSGKLVQCTIDINAEASIFRIILLDNILYLAAAANTGIVTGFGEFYIPFSLIAMSIGSYPDIGPASQNDFRSASLSGRNWKRLARIFQISDPAAVCIQIQHILVRGCVYFLICYLSDCDIAFNMANRSVKLIGENRKILKCKIRILSIITGGASEGIRCWIRKGNMTVTVHGNRKFNFAVRVHRRSATKGKSLFGGMIAQT